jgi:predicted RNA binding protein YcfA (HicA-like mRNA interferase family)
MKKNDLEKHLKKHNCTLVREGANHSIWANIAKNKQTTVPRHREIKNIVAKMICKQLEIPEPDKY